MHLFRAYKTIQWVPTSGCSSRFITYSPSLVVNNKTLEETPLNLGALKYLIDRSFGS